MKKLLSVLPDFKEMSVETAEGKMTLMGLFIPLFAEQLLMNMMGTVNTLMLGNYSDDAVAAVGAANQLIGFIYTTFSVISGGTSVVISYRLGEGRKDQASDAAFTSIVFSGIISLITGIVLGLFAVPLMKFMQLYGDVLDMAAVYFRIVISASFLQGIMAAVSAILRSYGKPKRAVVMSLTMNVWNVIFNAVVLYGPVDQSFRGTKGIALANIAARGLALALGMIFLATAGLELDMRHKRAKSFACIKNVLRIGVPGGVSTLSYSLSQVVSTSILAVLGTKALTAKIYVSSIVFYVYVIGYSLGLATAIMMGWMKGANEDDRAYRFNQQILRFSVMMNVGLSVIIFIFHVPLMELFTGNTEIIAMTHTIFLIDIAVEFGRAFNHIENNSLTGTGDVVFPMIIAIISAWGISILFSWLLGIKAGLGLEGCWIAFAMDEIFRGLVFFLRFRSKKWMYMKV